MKRSWGSILSIGVVFALAGAEGGLAQTSAGSSPAASKVPTSQKTRPARPNTYGTSSVSYVHVSQAAFLPENSNREYITNGFGIQPGGATRYGVTDSTDFNAPIQIPSGALVISLELDYCDTNAGPNYVLGTFAGCDYLGNNCVRYPTSGTSAVGFLTSQDGNRGSCDFVYIDMTPFNITINNYDNYYLLDIITQATDGSNSFAGMIVGYKLQVSPAPATQTFNDVAPGDFGYQYIEALVASGITGGCGGGNFCPTATLTRAQMAIFIAKALGLQWN